MRMRMLLIASIVLTASPLAFARSYELLALDASNTLLRFDAARPADVRATKVHDVTGTLIGIDHRPATGALYGLTDANDLYTIDAASGAATLVSTLTVAFDGGPRSGFDFNPQADRLRLLAASGQNLRVNVDLGATAVDAPLRYGAGDPTAGKRPAIAAAAYTSSVANAPSTKLFDIDSDLDVLALQDPPNDGVLVTIGPLGVDFGPLAGFDIVTDGGEDRGFAVTGATLYAVDLASGAAKMLGAVGVPPGANLIGLAVVPPTDDRAH